MWSDYSLFLSGTLISLLIAIIADAIIGDPDFLWRRIPHPVVWIGRAIGMLDHSFNSKKDNIFNKFMGLLSISIVLLPAMLFGALIQARAQLSEFWFVVQIVIVTVLLAQNSLISHIGKVLTALKAPGVAPGRKAVSMIVGRNPEKLDRSGIARATIESGAENLSDGIIAPAFWFILAGLPGLLAYKVINTADSMIGHKNEAYNSFGWAAARLDDVLNLIPARLTGILLCLVAPVAGGSIAKSFKGMIKEAHWHNSPNAGWPETATAFALGVSLAGPRSYGNQKVDAPWFNGSGSKIADQADILRVIKLLLSALLLHWLLYLAVYLLLS